MVMSANPHTMHPYARPMAKGADWALTKGLAGSRQDQMTMPMKESTKNSVRKRYPKFV